MHPRAGHQARSCDAEARRCRRARSRGISPFATTSRTRVFLVTTPTSCSSSVTKTARTSVLTGARRPPARMHRPEAAPGGAPSRRGRPLLTDRSPGRERGGVWGTGRFPTPSRRRGHTGETWFPP
jgi:hypothetical protein